MDVNDSTLWITRGSLCHLAYKLKRNLAISFFSLALLSQFSFPLHFCNYCQAVWDIARMTFKKSSKNVNTPPPPHPFPPALPPLRGSLQFSSGQTCWLCPNTNPTGRQGRDFGPEPVAHLLH